MDFLGCSIGMNSSALNKCAAARCKESIALPVEWDASRLARSRISLIVEHRSAFKILAVEPILQLPVVEECLRTDFMPDIRAAQKDPMRIFQDIQSQPLKVWLAVVSSD
jgi:hypothetical protein